MSDFIATGEYRRTPIRDLMFAPYKRIIIQQFVVILLSLFAPKLAGVIFVTLFVGIKIAANLLYRPITDMAMDKLMRRKEKSKQRRDLDGDH